LEWPGPGAQEEGRGAIAEKLQVETQRGEYSEFATGEKKRRPGVGAAHHDQGQKP